MSWLFAVEALLFVPNSLFILWRVLRPIRVNSPALSLPRLIVGIVIFAAVFCLGPLYAVAWWTTWKRKPSGRAWALAASCANVFWGLIPPVLSRLPLAARAHEGLVGPMWGLVVPGLAGVAAFRSHEAWAQEVVGADAPTVEPPPREPEM